MHLLFDMPRYALYHKGYFPGVFSGGEGRTFSEFYPKNTLYTYLKIKKILLSKVGGENDFRKSLLSEGIVWLYTNNN